METPQTDDVQAAPQGAVATAAERADAAGSARPQATPPQHSPASGDSGLMHTSSGTPPARAGPQQGAADSTDRAQARTPGGTQAPDPGTPTSVTGAQGNQADHRSSTARARGRVDAPAAAARQAALERQQRHRRRRTDVAFHALLQELDPAFWHEAPSLPPNVASWLESSRALLVQRIGELIAKHADETARILLLQAESVDRRAQQMALSAVAAQRQQQQQSPPPSPQQPLAEKPLPGREARPSDATLRKRGKRGGKNKRATR